MRAVNPTGWRRRAEWRGGGPRKGQCGERGGKGGGVGRRSLSTGHGAEEMVCCPWTGIATHPTPKCLLPMDWHCLTTQCLGQASA